MQAKEVGPYYYYTRSYLMKRQGDLNRAIALMKEAVARDQGAIFLMTELANLYLQHNDYEAALTVTQEIITGHPTHVPSMVTVGSIHAALNHDVEAIEAYKKALALDPGSEHIHLLLGSAYVKRKEWDKAITLYQNLIQDNPTSFAGHFYLGAVYNAQKQYHHAEAALLKCLELKPGDEQALFELINVYETAKEHTKVIDTYKKVLSSNPESIKASIGLGRFYLMIGKTEEAHRVLQALKMQGRSNPLVLEQIALMYLDQKRYQEAADMLQGLLENDLNKPNLHYFLGIALDGLQKTDEAIASFEKVPHTSTYHQSAMVQLSFLYQEKGASEKALHMMHLVLEKAPNEPELYLVLGALYEEMKAYDKAIEMLKKGLDVSPDEIRIHFRLGVVHDKAGDREKCIEKMRAVIEAEPTHAEALNYLGYTYAEVGANLDEAEDLIKRAMAQKPQDGYITDSLGWVYFKKGRYKEAIKFLEEAAKLVPDDATILEHLGDAYMKVNDPKAGLRYYKKALENKEKDTAPLEEKIRLIEKQLSQDA